MEEHEDIVIVGAGVAGLTTSLGLHRLGFRSLVLESSENLRVSGFALTTWTNAWRALDAVGISACLRQQHIQLQGMVVASTVSGQTSIDISFKTNGNHGGHEVRSVKRNLLLEALTKELPSGTIRYSSKVVSIEESGFYKLAHLADGTIIKTKVLIGCDGVNSVVGKWLGFKKPAFAGRSEIRGFAVFNKDHGVEPKSQQFIGEGSRFGFFPCDDHFVFWFFNWKTSDQGHDKDLEGSPDKMKQFVMNKCVDLPEPVNSILGNTTLDSILLSRLRYRHPWEVLVGNISKGNVCVAGDALHTMTPDTGQGACAALEDGIILARCVAQTLTGTPSSVTNKDRGSEEFKRIEMGLKRYATERRWRSFELISTAYIYGCDGKIMNFLRDKVFSFLLGRLLMKIPEFDCGQLSI